MESQTGKKEGECDHISGSRPIVQKLANQKTCITRLITNKGDAGRVTRRRGLTWHGDKATLKKNQQGLGSHDQKTPTEHQAYGVLDLVRGLARSKEKGRTNHFSVKVEG